MQACSINDLPDEILEYILSFLPPYEDLNRCKVVCKRWHKNVLNVIYHTRTKFYRAINNFDVQWTSLPPGDKKLIITKRYSHSACYHDNALYVFGGCTRTSTTFNDLWRLNLSTRQWDHLLTLGSYPSPKACATLVHYKDSMILFGGWTHPSPYPLHQAWRIFDELHIYETLENRWSLISSYSPPPAMAGHSATVHGNIMVVFGGLYEQSGSSNDVWCLNLENFSWNKQATSEEKPICRYGQSQIYINDEHVMIIGGCHEKPFKVLSDVWLLEMKGTVWQWHIIDVKNMQWAASHIWCNPACKIGDYVVVLNRNTTNVPAFSYSKWAPTLHSQLLADRSREESEDVPNNIRRASESVVTFKPIDRDININGRRGSLPRSNDDNAGPSTSRAQPSNSTNQSNRPSSSSSNFQEPNEFPIQRSRTMPKVPDFGSQSSNSTVMAAFRDTVPSHSSSRHRLKQLEAIKRMEERILKPKKANASTGFLKPNESAAAGPKLIQTSKMAMFVLDISTILTHKYVTWLPVKPIPNNSPANTILYSLTLGNGELIMFGGIQKDPASITQIQNSSVPTNPTTLVSNSLHFISAVGDIL